MADTAVINSPDYWNQRFALDWTARGGAEQTSFFARVAIAMLPDFFWDDARKNVLSFVDVGCALGEALPDFRERLPKSKLIGVDVSKVAIRMAKERLPSFTFRAVKEDWSDAPGGDIMFCSNTLEHLKDWKKRLARLGELADKYVLMLVPFQEWARIDEHVVSFDFTSFPASLPDGKRLLYFRILDAAQAPDTHWPGHQALAIYGPKVSARDAPASASSDPYAGVDFRGRPAAQVKATLLALQAAYPGAPQQTLADPAQALVNRINAEWARKLDASVAEMSAKHAELRKHYEDVLSERDAKLERSVNELVAKHGELKAHYERVLGERDAEIKQLSEIQEWRRRSQDLEVAFRDDLTQRLTRSEESVRVLSDELLAMRLDAERLRAERMQSEHAANALRAELSRRDAEISELRQEVVTARPLKMQVALLEKELANQIAALMAWPERQEILRGELNAAKAALERQLDVALLEIKQLQQSVLSKSATVDALKATLRSVVAERNLSRLTTDRLAVAIQRATAKPFVDDPEAMLERVQQLGEEKASHEINVLRTREHYESHISGLQAQLDLVSEISASHEQNALGLKEHYESHLHALRQELESYPSQISALQAQLDLVSEISASHEQNALGLREHYEAHIRALREELENLSKPSEREFVRTKEQELYIAALRTDVERLGQLSAAHEANVLRVKAHYEKHLQELNERLSSFNLALNEVLEGVRSGWRAELAIAQARANEHQQYASLLHAHLEQVLRSKSFALGHKVRRLFWLLRGVANPGIVRIPPPPPERQSARGEFVRQWESAKALSASISREANFAGASLDFSAPPIAPTVQGGQRPSHPDSGIVVAMQAATLANGGLERVVLDLCMGLQQQGVKVVVIAVSAGGPIADRLRENGVPVFEIDSNLEEYAHRLSAEGVTDLLLHHSYFGLDRAAQTGVRVYDVVHNYYFWHRDNQRLMERVAKLCAGVIYVSSSVRRFHEKLFNIPPEKGVVINNPAHLEGLIIPEKVQLRRLREQKGETVFLNVAQAFPAKAQAAMITAFARAWRENGRMRLQIAGAPVKPEVATAVSRRILEEGVADVVDLLGNCDRRKMSSLYAGAHAFVLPSLYEGYSVSALEAASYALPLIMTDVGGASDLLDGRGCGILLPAPVSDLSALEAREIELLGLASENHATTALTKAFRDIAGDRNAWIERGLKSQFKMVSLEEATSQYLSLITARASAPLRN